MNRKALLVGLLVIGGCGAESTPPAGPPPEFAAEVKLASLLPAGAKLTGVAVTPEGQTFVLDQRSGLYQLGGLTPRLVFSLEDISSRLGITPAPDLTDVVALGDERFALTAENDGYMLDFHNMTFASYFCYLPAGPAPGAGGPEVVSVSTQYRNAGIAVKQHTDAVAFNPDSRQLFAQPQTIRLDTGEVVGSELFAFPQGGGQPNQVTAMSQVGFLAGGMLGVAAAGQSLLLGTHSSLYRATASGAPAWLRAFETPVEIAGMARATNGNLLLLDSAGVRLLEVSGF